MFEKLIDLFTTTVYANIVSTLAFILSIIALAWTIHNDRKGKFKINMRIEHRDSFYLDAIWTETNSPASLVISARIINKSSQPVTISKIELWNGRFGVSAAAASPIPFPEYLPSPREDITKDENGNLQIWSKDGEGCHQLDIENGLIKVPFTLEPYGEVKGILLFDAAADGPQKTQKTKIRVTTSRGIKIFAFKIMTRKTNKQTSFYLMCYAPCIP